MESGSCSDRGGGTRSERSSRPRQVLMEPAIFRTTYRNCQACRAPCIEDKEEQEPGSWTRMSWPAWAGAGYTPRPLSPHIQGRPDRPLADRPLP